MKRLLLALSLLPASALAQDASPTPTAAPVATATVAATPKPATTPKAAKSPSPIATAKANDLAKRAKSIVDSLKREVSHRTGEARGIFERGEFDSDLKPKIGATMDRAIAHVELQYKRIDEAYAKLEAEEAGALDRLHDELEALGEDAVDEAKKISDVLTRGGPTEDNLQRIASEIRAIGEKSEELAEEVEEIIEREEELEDAGVSIRFGDEHDYGGDGDRVRYGGGITVDKGETVKDAVAFGGPVVVHGVVDGDAVAFGGDVVLSASGHVKGDAAAFGGHVEVEPGGKVDGEIVNMGPGAIGKGFVQGFGSSRHERRVKSWPAVLGGRMAWAGVQFMVFFLLGMLVLAAVPERTQNVARVIEQSPIKVGGFGVLLMIALVMISILLAITIIGALPLVFLVWPVAVAAVFFGYVGLATVMGRRLKTGVVPTPLAVFAIGAAIIAAVNLLPIPVKVILWAIGACFALGAVVMTRFGNPQEPTPPQGPTPVAP